MPLVLKLAQPGAKPSKTHQVQPEVFVHRKISRQNPQPGHYKWPGFFMLWVFLLVLVTSPTHAEERQTSNHKLSPGSPLNIEWQQGVDYQLQLPAELKGNWLVTVEQQGVDLAPALFNSKGEQILAVDVTGYSIGIERLALNTDEINSAILKLPRTTKIDSPGSFSINLEPVLDQGLFKLLRRLMAGTALLINKDAQIPTDINCSADVSRFNKDPGSAAKCFQAALNNYKPAYQSTISKLELEYYLADSVRRQGMLADAQVLYLPLIRQQQDLKLQALSLHGIAWTVWRSGEHKIGETFIAQALEVYKQVQQQQPANRGVRYQFLSARNIGCLILHDQEFLERAEACYLALLPDVQVAHDVATENWLVGNLGGVYFQLGDIASARKQFEKSYRQYQLNGDLSGEVTALANMAKVETRAGNLETALKTYRRAELLAVQAEAANVDVYRLLQAHIYRYLGDWQRAKILYKELEESVLHSGDLRIHSAISYGLALILDNEGLVEGARKYYLQSLDMYTGRENKTWAARTLLDLAELESRYGQHRAAEKYLSQAALILPQVENFIVRTRALYIQGKYLLRKGDHLEAITQLDLARNAYQSNADEYNQALVETTLVGAYTSAGKLDLAEQIATTAIVRYKHLRPENISLDLRASFSSRQRQAYEKLIDLYLLRWQQDKNPQWSRKALIWSERARAQTLREALERVDQGRNLNQEQQQQRQILSDHLNALAALRLAAIDKPKKIDVLNQQYQHALAELESFDQENISTEVGKNNLQVTADLDIDQLLANIPQQSAWLSFYMSDQGGAYWVLAKGQLHTYLLPATADFKTGIATLLAALRRPGAYQENEANLLELSRILAPRLPASITNLTITADGILNYLPFAALRTTTQTEEFWLQRFVIRYTPFIDIPSTKSDSRGQWQNLSIIADPEYEQSSISQPLNQAVEKTYPASLGLFRLRGSAVEAQAIAALARADIQQKREIEIYSGTDATRSSILDGTISNADILHFATHGIFSQQGSSLAGLALAVADKQGVEQPWLLTAQDIYQSPINARLVVMSACDVGTGKLTAGEGLLGLVRAFLYTGVEGVLSSQWKVSDRASVALMTAFYSSLFSNQQSVSAALRQAQLELLASDRYSDPFYWAGFSDFQIKGF